MTQKHPHLRNLEERATYIKQQALDQNSEYVVTANSLPIAICGQDMVEHVTQSYLDMITSKSALLAARPPQMGVQKVPRMMTEDQVNILWKNN